MDEAELVSRARTLASRERSTGRAALVVAGGPLRTVLRPAELENLRHFLLAEALTGADALLTPSLGTDTTISGDALRLIQNQGSSLVALDETANLLIVQPDNLHAIDTVNRDDFAVNGLARRARTPSMQLLALPSDPETEVLRLDDALWTGWMRNSVDIDGRAIRFGNRRCSAADR